MELTEFAADLWPKMPELWEGTVLYRNLRPWKLW